MNFMDAVRRKKRETGEVVPVDISQSGSEPELVSELKDADIPAGMSLTNSLDKMNHDQAMWVIKNGDAWIAYLKAKGIDLSKRPAADFEVSEAEKKKAIYDTIDAVGVVLSMDTVMSRDENLKKWKDTLGWAVSVMPECYHKNRSFALLNAAAAMPKHSDYHSTYCLKAGFHAEEKDGI